MHVFEYVCVGTNKYAFERVTLGPWVDVFFPSFSKFTVVFEVNFSPSEFC